MRRLANQRESRQGSEDLTLPSVCLIHPCCPVNLPTAAEGQLEAARSRLVRLKDIERSKDALISHYASLVPQALSELSSEEKNRIYKMMHLQILAQQWKTGWSRPRPASCSPSRRAAS